MFYINQLIQRFIKDEKGQALTEYGLIIALIAVALVATLILLGDELVAVFERITTELTLTP